MKAFSPLNCIVVINGVEITGYTAGEDVITVERLADAATHKIGVQGSMYVSLSADKSGRCLLKLSALSSSNSYLESLIALQENGADTFTPISMLFQDTFRQDMGQGSAGYMKKLPAIKRGEQASDQEWEIIVENLNLVYGD
jgi:structural protein KPP10_ORF10